jgi:hypothetical protein
MRLAALSLGLLLATSTAHADPIPDPPRAATDDQLVFPSTLLAAVPRQ